MPKVRTAISGRTSAAIAASIERALREGSLEPGAPLPTVRDLAATLSVSTSTVAHAYRALRQRGLIRTDGRRGTTITKRPPLSIVWSPPPPEPGLRDLASANPDPQLLPPLGPALDRSASDPVLYGGPRKSPELVRTLIGALESDGLTVKDVAIVAGAIDGIGRVLATQLAPGDHIAVEDPTFPPLFDVLSASAFEPEAVSMDRAGPLPDSLDRALRNGARAFVVTSRAQNPTGAAVGEDRSRELRRVLRRYPDVLVVEDDTGGVATDEALNLVTDPSRSSWAFVRSFSMVFGPDLRTAVVAADETTLSRLEGTQWVTGGWISHILQRLVWTLLIDDSTTSLLRKARRAYRERRTLLVDALANVGIAVESHSGFNVWIPTVRETTTVSLLEVAGWAVSPGEHFRMESPPGIRVTTSRLTAAEAQAFAHALADAARPRATTYAG
jgi:DNA-binding transcriptional MocR family regulator